MIGASVSDVVKAVQIEMAKIACATPIQPIDETLDSDSGDYISGSGPEPETDEDE